MRSTAAPSALVALLILVSGCTGAPTPGDTQTTTPRDVQTNTIPTTQTPTSATTRSGTPITVEGELLPDDAEHTQKTVPDPPDELTPASAVRVARQYEEAYLYQYFSNRSDVERFGLYGTVTSERAEIIDRTDDGYYVRVHHPFSFSTGSSHADGASNARYFVNTTTIERVHADYPN